MKQINVELLIEPNIDPRALVGGLARLTQLKEKFSLTSIARGEAIINSIKVMGHTSLLEPLVFGVVVHNATRVFLSQIRTHRHASFMSQSQQYQDQDNFPFAVLPELEDNPDLLAKYTAFMCNAEDLYRDLKGAGISKDQARYVLPGAARNDLFIFANAREWIEKIFPQRLCRRNTFETRYVISLILKLFLRKYDYLFNSVGPACITEGACDQGKMACGKPFIDLEDMLNENSTH